MNVMPMKTYNRFIISIGVYVLPMFVITNFPSMFLLKQMGAVDALWGILVPFVFLIILRVLWNMSVKHYKSASS
jgi:ABC-2 type transport system permease protein